MAIWCVPDGEHRQVVALFGLADEPVYLFGDGLYDLLRLQLLLGAFAEYLLRALKTEELLWRSLRLRQAVGIEEDGAGWSEHRLLGLIRRIIKHAYR